MLGGKLSKSLSLFDFFTTPSIINRQSSVINPLCCSAPHEFGPENFEIAVVRGSEQVDLFS